MDEGEVAVNTEAEYLSEKCKKMDLIGKMDQSVENRFTTPLKLPNLKTPASKKGSNATSKNHHGSLSTVAENGYDFQYGNSKRHNSRTISN